MTEEVITLGSICSGIEAASEALGPVGFKTLWLSEIDRFANAALAHHHPSVPNLGDMDTIAERILAGEVPAPDVLCGGTPCQAFSVAGLRNSLADERGNLTLAFVGIANAIDHVRRAEGKPPCVILWENVPGVFTTKDNAFGCFLAGLAGEDDALVAPGKKWTDAGCVFGPQRTIAWRVLDAQFFGLAQRRRRVFLVASPLYGPDPREILFESEGVRRDTAPSREEGQEIAGTLTAGARKCDHAGSAGGQLIAGTLQSSRKAAGCATQQDAHAGLLIPVAFGGNRTSGPLDVATALLAQPSPGWNGDFESETFLVQPLVFDTTQVTSPANYSSPRPGDPCHPLAAGAHAPAIAFPARMSATQHASTEGLSPALVAKNPTAVATQYGVRRLMPVECERLQGFKEGHTAIPWRGKPAEQCPDGPRYRALGNSWAVPVVRWLGYRMAQVIRDYRQAIARTIAEL